MSQLLIDADGKKSVVLLNQPSYHLGRSLTNEICYPDISGLSRQHLIIERNGPNWILCDLGSTNGTFVNGNRITEPHTLRHKDRVTIGHLSLVFDELRPSDTNPPTVVFVDPPSLSQETPTATGNLASLLREETEDSHGARHMDAVIRAARAMATHLPLEKLFDLILKLSVEAVGASRGVLMTLEGEELLVRAQLGAGFRISWRVRNAVLKEKRSLLVHDALTDSSLALSNSIMRDQVRSIMAVPLQTDEKVIGLIYVDSPHLVKEFTRQDLSLLTVMSNMAAVRIENARLAELEQAERLHAKELEHAAMIQRAMLPSDFPPFPDHPEFQLHASMTPAREVGGDLFDFFLLDDGQLGFVVGDVSGKGAPAALFMAVTRTLLRATASLQGSPGECLTYLNDALVEQNSSEMFVTMFYGVLDTATGRLQFANGGHEPPYLTGLGAARAVRDKSGPILGLFPGTHYRTHSEQLARGEAILLYTDGVTEAMNRQSEFFGRGRLEAYLAAQGQAPAEELILGLNAALQQFAGGAPQADDITLLALRYLGNA